MQYWARRLEQEIDGVMRIFGGVQQLKRSNLKKMKSSPIWWHSDILDFNSCQPSQYEL
ncbi:Voltage-dependent calcium channel subunit alpha-2/delta-2 [Varanus komodoensis]|nr:Voltage-dependent calcium channel subunit alpha-2/delta-2 [Varanus komodoensis]